MHVERLVLARAVAVGAVAASTLLGAASVSAASDDAPMLDRQLTEQLAPGQSATFRLQYAGTGDVGEVDVLPSAGPARLALRAFGPDGRPVELYDTGSAIAIKRAILNGPAGTYTIEVANEDRVPVEFAIGSQDTALTPDSLQVDDGGASDAASADSAG